MYKDICTIFAPSLRIGTIKICKNMASEVTSAIKYIGTYDADLDLFESQYPVPEGITYNSYLIVDDKIAIMDSVDHRKTQQWKEALIAGLDGRKPDYLVVQHMEPDHSASIAEALALFPDIKIVASNKAIQMLPQFFEGIDFTGRTIAVKEGDTLDLGHHTLQFIMAPMVHWPEVIMTYDMTDKVLFSADAFGTFGAATIAEDWAFEGRRYYINICGKYGPQVQSLLKKAAKLEINHICSLHGPILNSDIDKYIRLYDIWSKYEPEVADGILIAHASIYGGTAQCAERLAEMLREKGKTVFVADLCRGDISQAVAQAFRMGNLVVASATYDAGVFPPMVKFLHHITVKGYKNRRVGIIENGSWAPMAGKLMKNALAELKGVEIIEPTVSIKSRMNHNDLPALQALADALAR